MASKSIKRNYLYSMSYQVLALIIPFITTPYISRTLTAGSIGRFTFINSVVQYFTLFASMSIATFGQREIAYYRDDRKERTRIFWELKLLTLINVSVCMAAYLIFITFYAGHSMKMYLIMSLSLVQIACDTSWLFAGMEDFKTMTCIAFVLKILQTACIFIFIKAHNHVDRYAFNLAFFYLLGVVLMWPFLPEYVDKPEIKSLKPFRNMRTVLSLFIPTIALQIYGVLDVTMIGILSQGGVMNENGYYELCMRVIRITLMLVSSLSGVMIPRIGYLFKKGDSQKIRDYMYVSYKFIWFIAVPLCLGLVSVSDNFVPWFFGADFERVSSLLKIASLLPLVMGINNLTGSQYLIPTGRQNYYTLTVIIGTAVNCVMNFILIPKFFAYGAVVASVVAEAAIGLVQFYILRNELSLMKVLALSRNYLIAGASMWAVLNMLSGWPATPVYTFTLIFTGAAIYFAVLLILRDDFFTANAERVIKIIFRIH